MGNIVDIVNEHFKSEYENILNADAKWDEKPVSPEIFFKDWYGEELYPEQLKAINSIFTDDFEDFSRNYQEYLLLWGEGSGKDYICTRILTYCAYWTMCLRNPQRYFGLGKNEPIDLVNVSLSSNHAKDVFFKRFVDIVKRIINPETGENWFKEKGMDLRDNQDIQTTKILFKKNITAYSLNSQKYTGEGKNIILAVFDEVGEFKAQKAKDLYEALWHTAESRYGKVEGSLFKIFLISYMRHENDFMMHRWKQSKDSKNIYRSNKATWEVNLGRKRSDFNEAYDKNPEDASRRYENKSIAGSGNKFFRFPDRIISGANKLRHSPFEENILNTEDLNQEILAPWFLPKMTEQLYNFKKKIEEEGKTIDTLNIEEKKLYDKLTAQHNGVRYYIHIDLAKGIASKGLDCAGFAMVHKYPMYPEREDTEIGIYVDLMMQLRSDRELDFKKIREFIFKLKEKGFDIVKVTLDGYQSLDFQQRMRDKDIQSETLSVDKSNSPYNTLKSLIYNNQLDYYNYPVFIRELKELIRDNNGKIDHPVISNERSLLEGVEHGSKDVSDSVAGATYSALSEESEDYEWFSIL